MSGLKEEEVSKPGSFLGKRHLQYVLLFTVTLLAYTVRIAFNLGIIAIVSKEPLDGVSTYPEWASKKNVMLSSFFWGYTVPQVFAGQLAKNYGAKWFLAATTFLGSLFSLLIPLFSSQFGYEGVLFCRVMQGVCQSFVFRSVHALIGKWTQLADRAKISSFTYAGVPLGSLISMPLTGLLSKYKNIGWPAPFYLFGGVGIAWSLIWAIFGAESPSTHHNITKVEKQYTEYGLHSEKNSEKETGREKKLPTPWKSIIKSLPFWSILVCHCGENWGYSTLMTQIPSYFQKIMNLDIFSNGTLSALPYFAFWILSFVMRPIADHLITKKVTSRLASRKIFTSIAMFVPVISLFSASFVHAKEKALTISLLVSSVGSTAGIFSGYYINHNDIAPNHADTLMSITTMISNIFSSLAPLSVDLIGYVTGYQETDKMLWSIVFYIASSIYLVSGAFYIYGASADVQPWNGSKDAKRDDKDQTTFYTQTENGEISNSAWCTCFGFILYLYIVLRFFLQIDLFEL